MFYLKAARATHFWRILVFLLNPRNQRLWLKKALKEQLAAANQVATDLHEQVDVVKKKSEDQDQVLLQTQKELEEFKKQQ